MALTAGVTGPPGAVRERVVAYGARRPARRLVWGILTYCEHNCKGILVTCHRQIVMSGLRQIEMSG